LPSTRGQVQHHGKSVGNGDGARIENVGGGR
jgi:hypothetical protein